VILEPRTTERQLVDQFLESLRALPEVQAEAEQREPAGSAGDRRLASQIPPTCWRFMEVTCASVLRQSFWDSKQCKLREALARLVDDVLRAHSVKTLRDSGQLAAAGKQQPAAGVTHRIERDEQGRQVLRRERFSISLSVS
jgi:hypothetical protein